VPIKKAQGFALIDLIFVCGIIGLLCSIVMPRLFLARQAAGAASAIGSMRAISSAQLTYALTCGSGFYAPSLTTLGTPPPGSQEAYISAGLGVSDTVTKSSYIIQMNGAGYPDAPGSCNGVAPGAASQGFRAAADPANAGNVRFFGTNAGNTIWEDTTTLFLTIPEVGDSPAGHPLH
jgi:type II secretory pathway pseudopilin PulG